MGDLARLPQATVNGGITIRDINDLTRLSQVLAQSNYFQDARDASQAAVKVLCGLEMGIPAIAALAGVYIVKGKPMISANLMAAAVKRSGKYNYRVMQHSSEICEIAFFEGKDEIGRSVFTADDAKRAGTQNMDKYSKNMLFARALSNGVKWHCPDVFLGPVYTPEELGTDVNEAGEPIVASAVVVEPPANGIAPKNPNQATIKAVANTLGITDRDALAALGTAAMDNTFPGRKTSELNDAELDEYLAKFMQLWGMTQSTFRHDLHCRNAFHKLVDDPMLKGLNMVQMAGHWLVDVERRKSEKMEVADAQPELAEVPY